MAKKTVGTYGTIKVLMDTRCDNGADKKDPHVSFMRNGSIIKGCAHISLIDIHRLAGFDSDSKDAIRDLTRRQKELIKDYCEENKVNNKWC